MNEVVKYSKESTSYIIKSMNDAANVDSEQGCFFYRHDINGVMKYVSLIKKSYGIYTKRVFKEFTKFLQIIQLTIKGSTTQPYLFRGLSSLHIL